MDPRREMLFVRVRRRVTEIFVAASIAAALLWAGAWRRTGDLGLVRIADDEIAVVVDRVRFAWHVADRRVVSRPGYVVFVPLLQKVHVLDRRPRTLVLAGSRPVDGDASGGADRVPQLIARAKDGSSFWFEEIAVHHALSAHAVAQTLDDTGDGEDGRRKLLVAHARAALRDEVGRFTAEEIVQGPCLQLASAAALARLRAELLPHGVDVLEISLGRPRFDQAYEDVIQRRKTFDQEAEQVAAQLGRLEQEKAQKEAQMRKEKEVELVKLEASLVRDLGAAKKDDIRVRQDADDAFRDQELAGTATKLEKAGQAALVEARAAAAAEALRDEAAELERSGDLVVREALVQKLPGIEFTVRPYRRGDGAAEESDRDARASASAQAAGKSKP